MAVLARGSITLARVNDGEKGDKGDAGRGIKSTEVAYQAGASGTTAPTGEWKTSVPSVSAGQYLWTKTVITYTDSATTTTYSVARQGANGATGSTGAAGKDGTSVTVSSTSVTYQASASGTTAPTGTWSTSIPSVGAGQYLWTKTTVSFSDGKSATFYAVAKHGEKGDTGATGATGATGKGIKSTAVTYQAGTSATTAPTGTWAASVPSVSAGQYLWTRTVITYTDGATTTGYSVARQGEKGATGATGATGPTGPAGKGISSTAVTYQAHSSQTSVPTGTWSSSVPTLSTSKPYLWTKTVITYTDNATSTSYSVGSTLESFEVGGVNLLRNTAYDSTGGYSQRGGIYTMSVDDSTQHNGRNSLKLVGSAISSSGSKDAWQHLWNNHMISGNVAMLSFWVKGSVATKMWCRVGGASQVAGSDSVSNSKAVTVTTDWTYHEVQLGTVNVTASSAGTAEVIYGFGAAGTYWVNSMKLEYGNKATDWTPAPEDVQSGIDGAHDAADAAQGAADAAANRVTQAESRLDVLEDSISTLVQDANGTSLMKQTSTGWSFNLGGVLANVQSALDGVSSVQGSVNTANSNISNLKSQVAGLESKTAYINMTTVDSQPCIELGKSDSAFRVRITNTSIDFMQGSSRIAYVSNNTLYIEKAIVKSSLKIGDGAGYVWLKRSDGHLGLRYESS